MDITVALVIVLMCLWTYWFMKWRQVRDFWKKKGVAHSSPHPVFGSMTFLQKVNPFDWLKEEYNKFKPAPYFGIWLFWKPCLVISSPELAKNILVKDNDNFRNRYVTAGKSDVIGELSLLSVKDPLWTEVRRRVTFLFTASKLKAVFPLKVNKAKELVQRIKNETKKGARIDIRDLYANFTTDLISAAAYGIVEDATLTGDSSMRVVTREFMKYDILRGLSWSSIFFLPRVVDFFRFKLFPKASIDYFKRAFNMMVEQRGGWQKEVNVTKDMIDYAIKARKETLPDGSEITEDFLIAQAVILLQGGFDTTGVTMSFASYELAHHPDVQERLYEELTEAKDRLGGKDFDYQVLVDLPYLNAVIKETLRRWPAMGWIDRVALQDYRVDDKLTIPKGTPVYVNAGGIHFDPIYFPDPKKFDPDRFLPENEANIQPFTFMPFGEGPRSCIGMRFAYQTLRVGIAYQVLNFKIIPVLGEPIADELKADKRGMFMAPDRILTLNFEPRV